MNTLSQQDAWIFRRALSQMDTGGYEKSPLADALLTIANPRTPEGFDQLISVLEPFMAEILMQDPHVPPVQKTDDSSVYVPALPAAARLSDDALKSSETVSQWHQDFTEWASKRSPMTPRLFLEAGGVWAISLAIARRVCIHIHDYIFPHLYLLWVAPTTRFAKSTGLKAINHLITDAMPHMLMSQEHSPEALIETLAGQLPDNFEKLTGADRRLVEQARVFAAQRGILLDEASSLLGANRKDYMQGLSEWILKLYDAPRRESKSTRGGGLFIIKNAALSILGATTPAAMARTTSSDKWEDGELARYGLLYSSEIMPYNNTIGEFEPAAHLTEVLRALHERLPKPSEENDTPIVYAQMEAPAMKAYQAYTKAMRYDLLNDRLDPRLHGNYGRMHIQALKVALAFATIDWTPGDTRPVISIGHWAKAQMMVEQWRASLHHLLPAINVSADSRAQKNVENILENTPGGLTIREMSRKSGIASKRLKDAIQILLESGEVEEIAHNPIGGGRPTKIYRRVLSQK